MIDAAFDFGAVLNVLEDRIVTHRDGFDVHDRIHPRAGEIVILEFAEGSFRLTDFRWNFSFQDDLGMSRDFQIDGLALHELHLFLQQRRGDLELIHAVLCGGRRGEVVHRMVTDQDRDRHRLILRFIHLIIRPGVARIEENAEFLRTFHLQAMKTDVAPAGLGILGDHQPGPDVRTPVTDTRLMDRHLRDVYWITDCNFLLHGPGLDHARCAQPLRAAHKFRDHLVAVSPKGERRQRHITGSLSQAAPTGKARQIFEKKRAISRLPQQRSHLTTGIDGLFYPRQKPGFI